MTMHDLRNAIAFAPTADTTRLLRDAFGQFATGVTVVTAASADGPVGITANSFSSVSLDPPLVLWSIGKKTRRYPYFADAAHYAIHVLGAHQKDLCDGFARDAHVLRTLEHRTSAAGVPLIPGCLARFECCRVAAYDGGDHSILLGRVEAAEVTGGEALTFFAGAFQPIAQQ